MQAGQGGAQKCIAPGDKTGEIVPWNMRAAEAAASNFSKDIPRVLNGRGCQQLLSAKMKSILCLNTIQWWWWWGGANSEENFSIRSNHTYGQSEVQLILLSNPTAATYRVFTGCLSSERGPLLIRQSERTLNYETQLFSNCGSVGT